MKHLEQLHQIISDKKNFLEVCPTATICAVEKQCPPLWPQKHNGRKQLQSEPIRKLLKGYSSRLFAVLQQKSEVEFGAFTNSNRMFNAKIKSLKKQGKENVQHKDAIPVDDLKKLKAGPVSRLTYPWSLLRNVWFHVVLCWCRRGREGQRNLKPSSFKFAVDEQG